MAVGKRGKKGEKKRGGVKFCLDALEVVTLAREEAWQGRDVVYNSAQAVADRSNCTTQSLV